MQFLSLVIVSSILHFALGLADLFVEYFDGSEDGVDVLSECDCVIEVFGGLIVDFHGNFSVELCLSGIAMQNFVESSVHAVVVEAIGLIRAYFLDILVEDT